MSKKSLVCDRWSRLNIIIMNALKYTEFPDYQSIDHAMP